MKQYISDELLLALQESQQPYLSKLHRLELQMMKMGLRYDHAENVWRAASEVRSKAA